ncbi:MAG: four helix bundle protein [Planctomycetes bacterium]|nr:four helix bundle protein [Planctomycetota bacterium]
MQDFRNLEVWQRAYALALEVYRASRQFPREEIYSLTSQVRRCSISIPSNVAEGCGRQTDADFKRFLHIAMGSAAELECQLMLIRDLKLIDIPTSDQLLNEVAVTRKMLNALIQRLKQPPQPRANSHELRAKSP